MGNDGSEAVSWSASRARLYEVCPRRFYYRYVSRDPDSSTSYPGSGGTVARPGAKVGMVVHDCIEDQVQRWRAGESLSLQAAQTSATEQLQAYLDGDEDTIEELYSDDEEFDATDFARSLVRTAHSHLECFFQVIWPQLADHQYILHEQTTSFEVGGETVWVKPDLCTRSEDGDFVVTDWKTSPPAPFSAPSLQVLTYALWAHEEYEPDLDRILVQLVHTKQGEFDRTRPDEAALDDIRSRITADCEMWRTADGRSEFDPLPEEGKCRGCFSLSRCSAGL
jgi:hypothetical protein